MVKTIIGKKNTPKKKNYANMKLNQVQSHPFLVYFRSLFIAMSTVLHRVIGIPSKELEESHVAKAPLAVSEPRHMFRLFHGHVVSFLALFQSGLTLSTASYQGDSMTQNIQ